MVAHSNYRLTRTQEKELRQKLAKNLMAIVGITVSMIILVMFFSPLLGTFFGFFSRHRNEADTQNAIKPNIPFFVNVPNATKEDRITLNGYAQAGMTIKLYVNGPEVQTTTVGADGQFAFNDVQMIQGSNTMFAKAIDQIGVESDNSTTYTIVQDKENPKLEIESPKENETVKNLDKRVTIKGKANEKVTIVINEKTVVVRPDLTFEFLLGVKEGTNTIKISATDEAGNKEEKQLTITYKNEL